MGTSASLPEGRGGLGRGGEWEAEPRYDISDPNLAPRAGRSGTLPVQCVQTCTSSSEGTDLSRTIEVAAALPRGRG